MTTNAVRALLVNEREKETAHAVEIATCQGATRLAEHQRQEAEKALESAGWWSRYGFLLGLGAGTLTTGALAALLWRATR